MPRIEPGHPGGLMARIILAFTKRSLGQVPASMYLWGRHRQVFHAFAGVERRFLAAKRLPLRLKTLVSIRAAMVLDCPFCIDIGSSIALRAGLPEEQLRDLPNYAGSAKYSEAEKLCLAYADAMTASPTTADDKLFRQLQKHFDDEQLVELTAMIAWENCRGRFNHAMGVEIQGYCERPVLTQAEAAA
jgi:AhpD family alkylhydroperoxidase